jgi:hypothetical protein
MKDSEHQVNALAVVADQNLELIDKKEEEIQTEIPIEEAEKCSQLAEDSAQTLPTRAVAKQLVGEFLHQEGIRGMLMAEAFIDLDHANRALAAIDEVAKEEDCEKSMKVTCARAVAGSD